MTQRRIREKRTQLQTWVGPRSGPTMTNCIEMPTDDEIQAELSSLPGGDCISSVRLCISKTHYMGLGGSLREGFSAMHEEHSAAGLWETIDEEISLQLATRLLSEYRDETNTWRGLVAWRRCSFKPTLKKRQAQAEADRLKVSAMKAAAFVTGFLDGFRKK